MSEASVDPDEVELTGDDDIGDRGDGGAARRQFIIRHDRGARLDVYLHNRLKGISRSKIQKLIDLGGVTINDKPPRAASTVRKGDRIDVVLPAPAIRRIDPEPIPLEVLYEDDAFIVINKQANLIVHPARSHLAGTLLNGLAWHFKQQLEKGGKDWQEWQTRGFRQPRRRGAAADTARGAEVPAPEAAPGPIPERHGAPAYDALPPVEVPGLSRVGGADLRPGIIHRLDKNTTGVMVVAKHDQAHWQIARQFEDRLPVKAYLAIAHGNIDPPSGVIDVPIGKHPTIREAYAVRHDNQARHAVTLYRVREQYAGYCLVELELKTGRTHQIRVHLQYIGHPIVGDIVYGGEPIGEAELDQPPIPAGSRKFVTYAREKEDGEKLEAQAQARPDLLLAHPALHAGFLRFTHPFTGRSMTFQAPVHAPMRDLIGRLRQRAIAAPVVREGTWIDLAMAVPAAQAPIQPKPKRKTAKAPASARKAKRTAKGETP